MWHEAGCQKRHFMAPERQTILKMEGAFLHPDKRLLSLLQKGCIKTVWDGRVPVQGELRASDDLGRLYFSKVWHCHDNASWFSQVKLTNIDAVSLLDKRGYLTIAISQKTEGRVYLRLQEGIRDWFYHIQSTVYESKKRRKFWVKGPTYPSHTNNRLARLYGENKPGERRAGQSLPFAYLSSLRSPNAFHF